MIGVTGASGFIGQAICRRLLAGNYTVRALIRDPRKAHLPALTDCEIVRGDVTDVDSLRPLVIGTDAIIHCAGNVRGASRDDFDDVNVGGTRNLLCAMSAVEAAAPRLLLISSLAAREPQLSDYAASKRQAEQLLETEAGSITWTVLRPPAVYGPGDRELLPIFRLMAHGIALTAGPPTARFSMLYVDDLANAAIACLRSDSVAGGIFDVDDGHAGGYDWREVGRIVGQLCRRRIHVLQPAAWLLDLTAWLNVRLGAVFGTAPMITPGKLRELRHTDWVCDNAELRRAVDWRPVTDLTAGLRATPGWSGRRRTGIAPG
ncbi:MAG: NAD-dependent epimerase/dehydratase family protein [Gammaproteobacteria bacterium]